MKSIRQILGRMMAFLILTIFIAVSTFAQDKTVRVMKEATNKKGTELKVDSGKTWKTGGIFNLNIGQGSQSNWAAGGDDFTFSLGSYLGFYALYKEGRYSWDNTVDLIMVS